MSKANPFKYFNSSPEIIKLAVMYYARFLLNLRQVGDILHERGIGVGSKTKHRPVNYFLLMTGLTQSV